MGLAHGASLTDFCRRLAVSDISYGRHHFCGMVILACSSIDGLPHGLSHAGRRDICLSGTRAARIRDLRNDYTGACHLMSTTTVSLLSTCSLLMSPSLTLVSTANAHSQVPAHLQKGPGDRNQRLEAGRRWRPISPLPKRGLISS